MVTRILPVLLILLLVAAWIIDRRELSKRIATRWRCVFWLPNVSLALALIFVSIHEGYTMGDDWWKQKLLTYTLLLGIPQTVYALLYLTKSFALRLGGALIVFLAMLYGLTLGWRGLCIVNYDYESPAVPSSFDGYRIAQASDLHLGTMLEHKDFVMRYCDSINALKPDLIVLTGDLVNYQVEELAAMKSILATLEAPDGVVSVMGNHDYLGYYHWENKADSIRAIESLRHIQEELGWLLLENEALTLHRGNDSVVVLGLANDGPPRFPSLADKALTRKVAEQPFCIFLQHDPSYFSREIAPLYTESAQTTTTQSQNKSSLTLSGHTHAMQLRIFGWSPAAWFYPEWGGEYSKGNATLYVSQGIGSVLIPFRLGAWPEINLITLRHKP